MKQLLCVLAMTISAAACSGGKDSPAAPTPPPTPTVSSITISGPSAFPTGFFATYTATAQLSNGTTQDITALASWTTDNGNIATAAPGRVTANNNGTVTLSVSNGGRTGTKAIRIVSNYGGSWSGTYVLRSCDQSGEFTRQRWCQGLGVGSLLPFTLSLTQFGGSADQISGTIGLGGLIGATSGTVTGDGRLNIGGTYNVNISPGFTVAITIGGWNSTLNSGSGMTGSWATNLVTLGTAGNAFQNHDILSVTHNTIQSVPVETRAVESLGEMLGLMKR